MLPPECGAASAAVRCGAGREGRAAHHAHEHGRMHGLVGGPVHPSHQLGRQPALTRLHLPHLLVQEARLCHTAHTLPYGSKNSTGRLMQRMSLQRAWGIGRRCITAFRGRYSPGLPVTCGCAKSLVAVQGIAAQTQYYKIND